mmetsp:Transcript_35510/g.89537  ORF Transcript_35510/g.89537 Transcript_35510/m.89537 type:complete len:220 (-) Transcript_35510:1103-1762(-)
MAEICRRAARAAAAVPRGVDASSSMLVSVSALGCGLLAAARFLVAFAEEAPGHTKRRAVARQRRAMAFGPLHRCATTSASDSATSGGCVAASPLWFRMQYLILSSVVTMLKMRLCFTPRASTAADSAVYLYLGCASRNPVMNFSSTSTHSAARAAHFVSQSGILSPATLVSAESLIPTAASLARSSSVSGSVTARASIALRSRKPCLVLMNSAKAAVPA